MPDPESAVVLVVDSEASVLKNVSATLGKAGFTVLTALGAGAVSQVCEHLHEPIQLAIMDTAMAAGDSDLVDHLCGSNPGMRILFTSSQDESSNVRQHGRAGKVRQFLQKPFRRSQLLGRVLEVMDAPMVRTA